MYYADIKKVDVANGPGVRVSLFVSGCTHKCKGCFNEEAWDFKYGHEYTQKEEDKIIELLKPDYTEGITILGGEPFEYVNQKGIFKTYNCTGACFLVKTKVLQALDYFDEYYFFMPEDLALSTLANKRGYNLYVDSNITLYHLQQQTGSKVKVATLPAARKGSIYLQWNIV